MSKFRPFDYLTEDEQQEVRNYEGLLQRSKTVQEFVEIERILKDYRSLGIARKNFDDLRKLINSSDDTDDEESSSHHNQVNA